MQKPLSIQPITPPPAQQRVSRQAAFADEGEKRNRYHLPTSLDSASPVGFRMRVPLSTAQVNAVLPLLCLERPTAFVAGAGPTEQELFEEASLGVLSSRQSTNFRGHRQVTVGPTESKRVAELLRSVDHLEGSVLEGAAYTHICLARPYRTPFTFLLTFIGHKKGLSLGTVPLRGIRKTLWHEDDIPTIGYLQHLHLGIWMDAMERASLVASQGTRRANVFSAPFCTEARRKQHAAINAELEAMVGMTDRERRLGWRVHLVTQVGTVPQPVSLPKDTWRKLGANLLSFRSERIQPGVNQEEKAPPSYQSRQDMDVSDDTAFQAGRAGYNAFAHWAGVDREKAKQLLLMERVDVLTEQGKQRLRAIRTELGDITDRVVDNIPLWADLPTGKLLSSSASRGRKAFALAGQRIYIGGLDRNDVEASGLEWNQAVRAFGAAAARSALYCELAGVTELPADCDLLAGICLMAGPVNQNDVGKQFFEYKDLLANAYPGKEPTSLLVWTLKAKTVADPIGNEEQLMNPARKGALVDLRCAPHDVVATRSGASLKAMRKREGRVNAERAFGEVGNFVVDAQGKEIPGNRGSAWPRAWAEELVWPVET
ncbi:MAG: hypothetical protein ACI9VR_001952 [Cognaticolwellia sp.]|jgi:hypothetical protein